MKLSEKLRDDTEVRGLVRERAAFAELLNSLEGGGRVEIASEASVFAVACEPMRNAVSGLLRPQLDRVEGQLVSRGIELDLSPDEAAELADELDAEHARKFGADEAEDEGEADDE